MKQQTTHLYAQTIKKTNVLFFENNTSNKSYKRKRHKFSALAGDVTFYLHSSNTENG